MDKNALRLTLRTLLAYLDDSLEAAQARDMGARIKESDAARKLVHRLTSAVRKRRLVAPDIQPKLATLDANDSAEYLDNVLDSEKISDLEKSCMDDDVHLAEVSSVHQILTLVLGEPLAIPPQSYKRMYAIGGTAEGGHPKIAMVGPERVLPEPAPEVTARGSLAALPGVQLIAVVVVLVFALSIVIWQTLIPPPGVGGSKLARNPVAQDEETQPNTESDSANNTKTAETTAELATKSEPTTDAKPATATQLEPAPKEPATTATSTPPVKDKTATPATKTPAPAEKSTTPDPTKPNPPANTPAKPAPTIVPMDTLKYLSTESVLLVENEGKWTRVEPEHILRAGEKILQLEGYRSELETANGLTLELVGQCRLSVERDGTLRLEEGKIILRAANPTSLQVPMETGNIFLNFTVANFRAGLSVHRLQPVTSDQPEVRGAIQWRLVVVRGEVECIQKERKLLINGGHELVIDPAQGLQDNLLDESPEWLTSRGAEGTEARALETLAAALPVGKDPSLALREKATDRSRDVRRLAAWGLAATRQFAILAEMMDSSRSPADFRQNAIRALRSVLSHDDAARAAFLDNVGIEAPDAKLAFELLLGYSEKAAAKTALYGQLIEYLDDDSLRVRELAIFNLKELTGTDRAYSADAPRRKTQVDAWKRWLSTQSEKTLPPKRKP